ncbi:CRISPR-associated helicase Cas3' [Arcobacter sp. YIC-310]|uniref:CRISPR-associated helicase Cas3' n=1 Tax=Arcobacter sp. YIC-310 TaxID=3376632 RepID=UPI003C2080B1
MIDLKEFGVDATFLAHTPNESLLSHSKQTYKYFQEIVKVKGLEEIIDGLIYNIDNEHFEFIKQMFESAIFLHDVGKINGYFQANKMSNPHKKFDKYRGSTSSSEHSSFSKIEYLKYYAKKLEKIKNRKVKSKLEFILYCFSYHIAKHHGKLSAFEDYDEKCISFFTHIKKYDIEEFEFYILNKLLFSLLVSSDYYATTEYMADLPTEDFGIIKDKQKIINRFEDYKIIKNIRNNENLEGINILRSKMFLEAEENIIKNFDKNIFYLEAPTGSGKTLTSINLAMKLLKKEEINKIFYIFPFNTLVEQTKKQIDDIFKDDLDTCVINSITPIKEKTDEEQENEESKYQKSYMNRLFFHNELILTTHVSFFDILFGTSKEENFPLWQLANSVIILDEIQSYDNKLWSYMIQFFSIYAKVLNIKIIIMSATLPKLDDLLTSKENIFVELIKNKDEYFKSKYFKSRVELDFSLLEEYKEIKEYKVLINKLDEEKNKYSKIVFEFIKKDSAREFFEEIKRNKRKFKDFEIYELSGDDNKATREKIIAKIKKEKNVKLILVATQVIEAGVDIDMDLGFKDISIIDSEEQFLGRINRSCLKLDNKYKPKVYFFNKDDESKIYKKDNRLEDNLKKEEFREILLEKDFKKFYEKVFQRIKKDDSKIEDGIFGNFEKFSKKVQKLNYKEIKEQLKLINTQSFRLYFPFKLNISNCEIDEFKNKESISKYLDDDGKLDGQLIWEDFEKLNDIEGYAKKEIEKRKIDSLMQFFTFNITKYSDTQTPPYHSYTCGAYYFISNYEEFIEDGKFNRKAYQKKNKDIFW